MQIKSSWLVNAKIYCSISSHLTLNFLFFCSVEGVKYEDRACCEIGSNVPSEMCGIPDEIDTTEIDTSTNSIGVGGILGITLFVLFVIICICRPTNKRTKRSAPAAATPSTNTLPVASVSYAIPATANDAQVTYGGVTAAHLNPEAAAQASFSQKQLTKASAKGAKSKRKVKRIIVEYN